jgi:hypothetical protein
VAAPAAAAAAAAAAAETASRIDICLAVLEYSGGGPVGEDGCIFFCYIVLTVMCDKYVIVYNPSYILFIKLFGV